MYIQDATFRSVVAGNVYLPIFKMVYVLIRAVSPPSPASASLCVESMGVIKVNNVREPWLSLGLRWPLQQ